MANFNLPALTSTYTNFITELKNRDNTISSLFSDGTDHVGNYPIRAIRWNTSGYFQRRNSNNNGWERLEGNGGTHYFENIETGAITATGGATITGAATVSGRVHAGSFNVTGTSKPANGFYLPASNEMRLATNSTDRITIESNGQVGINQPNPNYGLDITGTFRIQNGSTHSYLEVGTGGTGNRKAYIDLVGDETNTNYGLRILRESTGKNAPSFINHRGTGNFVIDCLQAEDNTGTGANIQFKQNGVVKVRINQGNGFVAIGDDTFTPTEFLHIKHSVDDTDEAGAPPSIRLQNPNGSAYIRADNDDLFLEADTHHIRNESGNTTYLTANSSLFDIKTNAKVNGTLQTTSNVTISGNITVSGTVDGQDIAAMGTKLSNIDDDATDDMTGAEILAELVKVDTNTSTLNANFLQGKKLSDTEERYSCVPFIDSVGNIDVGKKIDFFTADNAASKAARFELTNGLDFQVDKDFIPAGASQDLGSSDNRWRNLYINDLKLSNEGSVNDVDGTWGDWTLQEAEENIFMINHRNGKKYKINMTEVAN